MPPSPQFFSLSMINSYSIFTNQDQFLYFIPCFFFLSILLMEMLFGCRRKPEGFSNDVTSTENEFPPKTQLPFLKVLKIFPNICTSASWLRCPPIHPRMFSRLFRKQLQSRWNFIKLSKILRKVEDLTRCSCLTRRQR